MSARCIWLAFFVALLALAATAAEMGVMWTNDTNNPPTTVTVVSYGIAANTYTGSVTVPYPANSILLTNLAPGRKYYVAARAFDGIDTYSVWSNEDSGKTRLNTPKNLTLNP